MFLNKRKQLSVLQLIVQNPVIVPNLTSTAWHSKFSITWLKLPSKPKYHYSISIILFQQLISKIPKVCFCFHTCSYSAIKSILLSAHFLSKLSSFSKVQHKFYFFYKSSLTIHTDGSESL